MADFVVVVVVVVLHLLLPDSIVVVLALLAAAAALVVNVMLGKIRQTSNESFPSLEASLPQLGYQVAMLELYDRMMTTESLFLVRDPNSR